ncbi:putative bir1 protein [Plasmodium yoelii yoelii]|nr:putative bir1 protein [Plasmodium yoelii yoelii]
MLKNYCPKSGNCNNDIDKINAGFLWLFNAFFGKHGSSVINNTYKDDTVCIMIWLSYMLNLKSHDGINTLKSFYSQHIQNNEKYTKIEVNDETYDNYKKIIDEIKEYMDINISHMSRFYKLLKLLCNMNTAYTRNSSSKCSEHAKKFADEYEKLFNDNDNIEGSSYNKVLRVLSRYYNNFEKGRSYNNISLYLPSLSTEKTSRKVIVAGSNETKIDDSSIGIYQSNLVTTPLSFNTILSDSSILNKLIRVLSILVAIPIFWGISYKYSLFGFRKRSQKQNLREKLKKIRRKWMINI